ncbi:MAG: type II secretion system F family protein [Armatimonadetes bacterium]|nr:type II secretion system F family protein [Armatimonadota bacterium]
MPAYEFTARDSKGRLVHGEVTAANPLEAHKQLRGQGLWITELREKVGQRVPLVRRPSPQALALFFRHLHSSLRAGLGLPEAVIAFADNQPNSPLAVVAREAGLRMSQGLSLYEAFKPQGFLFPPYVLPMIRAGEKSGRLDEVFRHLADHFDREHRFLQTIRSRTFYPRLLAIILVALIVTAQLVSPFLARLLNPRMDEFILGHYRWALAPGTIILVVMAALAIGWLVWTFVRDRPALTSFVETIRLSIPWFATLPRLLYASRFGRALAMLYAAGVEPGDSLRLAGQASGSLRIKDATDRLAPRLEKGESLLSVVRQIPLMPPMVLHIVSTAEKTGTVDEGLNRAAEYLESEAEVAMNAQGTVIGLGVLLFILILGAVYVVGFWARWYLGLFGAVEEFINPP